MQSFRLHLVSALQTHSYLLNVLPPLLPCVYQFLFFLAHQYIQLGTNRRLLRPGLILVFPNIFLLIYRLLASSSDQRKRAGCADSSSSEEWSENSSSFSNYRYLSDAQIKRVYTHINDSFFNLLLTQS